MDLQTAANVWQTDKQLGKLQVLVFLFDSSLGVIFSYAAEG